MIELPAADQSSVAVAATLDYAGILLAPPTIGLLADQFGLRLAPLTIALMIAIAVVLSPVARRRA